VRRLPRQGGCRGAGLKGARGEPINYQPSTTNLTLVLVAALMVVAALAGACGNDAPSSNGRLKVVTTLPLFAEMVGAVGGDRVDVSSLAPAGADPHTFEPSPQDVQRVSGARLGFGNGLDLEPATEKLLKANLPGGAVYLQLGERAAQLGAQVIDENPHLWLDLDTARLYARIIRDSLVAADPDGTADYNANYDTYAATLDDVAAYARTRIDSIPAANRKLVTTHDAFPYLARYLGLEIVAFAEEGPGQDISPQAAAGLRDALKQQNVPAVFTEPQIGSGNKVLESAASDAGVQVCTLYSDSFDDKVRTYAELMRFDADELARCLGGSSGG